MRLTRKDLAATLVVAVIGGLFAWHLAAPDTVFVGSTRWMAGTMFVLGVVTCAVGSEFAGDSRYSSFMAGCGALSFALAGAGVITGSGFVLGALVAVLGFLWVLTTARHAMGIYPKAPVPVPDGSHEMIDAGHRS